MSDKSVLENIQNKKQNHSPNVGTLLKISLGLIFLTLISSAFVYAEIFSVDVEGTSFDVDYTTTGLTISNTELDLDFISMIVSVDVTDSPGILDITLDRSFFDSTFNGEDDDFIILVDGDEPKFTETQTTLQGRTLSIELPFGTEEVEIIGSSFNNLVIEPTVEPTVEPTAISPSVDDTSLTQCGPGTVLKNNACVLDERCGPGTVLVNEECVIEELSVKPSTVSKTMGKELITGVIAALVIAGIVGIILGLMAKASKK